MTGGTARRPPPGRWLRSRDAPPTGHDRRNPALLGLGVDQVNRRFAAASAAAGLEGRKNHAGRPREPRRSALVAWATHTVQLVGGWKDASMVVHYASVALSGSTLAHPRVRQRVTETVQCRRLAGHELRDLIRTLAPS